MPNTKKNNTKIKYIYTDNPNTERKKLKPFKTHKHQSVDEIVGYNITSSYCV